MKTYCPLLLWLILFQPSVCFAQPSLNTDYFRSAGTGNWSSAGSWQSSHDNLTYFPATLAPSSAAAGITIQNLHTVTINSSGVSMINTIVKNGGTLEITSTVSYSIDGSGDNLIVENGGILLLNFTSLTAPLGIGTALVKTGGKIIANAVSNAANAKIMGDNYLNINSKFTYQDKAIFEWKIANTILPSNNNDNYFKTPLSTDLPILRISTTPVSSFGTTSNANIFNCILEVNASIAFATSGTKTFRGGLSGTGTIGQSGGPIILPTSTSVLDGSLTINIGSSGLKLMDGAVVPNGANVKITVPTQNDQINKQEGNLQVNGTLDITNCRINNTGTSPMVTIAGGGILKVSNTNGFSGTGASIVSGPVTLDANSTIEFNNVGDQNFNARTDFKNLTFSGSGIKKPSSGFDPIGTIKITGTAVLDCTGYNVGDGSTNANLTMDGGRLIVSTGSTQPRMGGVYNLTGGVVEFTGTAAKTIRSETYQNIEVNGTNVGNSSSNITLRNLGTFVLKNGSVFTINDNGITGPSGTQTVQVENGATFNCGNNEGFHGFTATFTNNSSIHSNIENIILDPGSIINYSRDNNQPITNSDGLVYQNLIVSGIAGNKTAPSGTLTIQGNFTKSGASEFVHNNGTVIFSNAVIAQGYTCTSTIPVSFYNLSNGNTGAGLNVLSNMGIVNDLTMLDNSKLNCTAGDITLLSTATNTARVAPVPASASLTYGAGRFIVERYFPNSNPLTHRAWRLVTAPLNETGTIFDSWQLSGAAYGAANYHRGTLITGPQIMGNGLDYTPTNNYSLKNHDGTNFQSITNTNVPVTPAIGTGYFLFVRGDRNPALTNIANSDYTTLSAKGKLQTGDVNINVPNTYALAGNPFASPIDFNLMAKSNVNPHRFYVWDPTLNAVGGYAVIEDYGSPGIFKPTAPYAGSSQNNYIQSYQAFFVEKASAGAASITFHEGDKVSNYNPAMFRPVTEPGTPGESIRANLFLLNADSSKNIADGNLAEFNTDYSTEIDINDALKFGNINESFCLTRNSQKLAVERRSPVMENDTLFYVLTRTTQHQYQVEIVANISSTALIANWEDSYSQTFTPVNIMGTTYINFAVNDDSASAVANRFRLVFKNIPAPLAIAFNTVEAVVQNDAVLVKWTIENGIDVAGFDIEKSADGASFNKLNSNTAAGYANLLGYQWVDENPMSGDNLYRIKSISKTGEIVYSKTVKIKFDKRKPPISILTNPVTNGFINVQFNQQPAGIYQIRLLNDIGQVLQTKSIHYTGGNFLATLNTKRGRPRGVYFVQIAAQGKIITTLHVEVQTK